MFTGIIEEVGAVESLERGASGGKLRIRCRTVIEDIRAGASISVNGVCLTAVDPRPGLLTADVAPETLDRSNLGELRRGVPVNLERPLAASGRLSGHIVQGHVDATGELASLKAAGDGNWWLDLRYPAEVDPYLVFKGSVALDGMSLTIAAVRGGVLRVAVIPHTYANTNLRSRKPGDRMNIECDILAKYLEKLLQSRRDSGLTMDRLRELGF